MYSKELKIAIEAVKKSEPTFRKYFGTKTKVEMKGGNFRNLVSYADKKIETDIKKILLKQFPTYGFIGEELGNINTNASFVWALDPIDGTTNYLQGLPDCAISLALLKNSRPVVGVVSAPLLNRVYTANLKGGAKLNGKKIQVSKTKDLKFAFGSVGWGRDIEFAIKTIPLLLPKIRKLRVPGSAALGICYVASGNYDFFVDKTMNVWDYAAGQIILEEADGKFYETKNPSLQIAANEKLVQKIFKLIK